MRYTPEAVAEKARQALADLEVSLCSWIDFGKPCTANDIAWEAGDKAIDALAPHTDGALIDVSACIAKKDVDSADSEFALKVSLGYDGGVHNFQALMIVVDLDGKVEIDTRDCCGPVIDALKGVTSG